MDERDSNPEIDPLLRPFLWAIDKAKVQFHLDQLIALVTPDVEKITRRSSSPEDACNRARSQLIEKLYKLKDNPHSKPIKDFRHYACKVAANARGMGEREEHPRWNGLKDSLRGILRSDVRFALWKSEDQKQLCGLTAWRDHPLPQRCNERLLQLLADPHKCEDAVLDGRDAQRLANADLLEAIFAWVSHPLEFNDLVVIVFHLKRLEEWSKTEKDEPPILTTPEDEAVFSELLKHIWAETVMLPQPERTAYLLNFRAAEYGVEVFPFYGIVSLREIGATLQLSDEQFASAWAELDNQTRRRAAQLTSYDEKFALLWQYLPLKDNVIAKMLGMKRQDVINLRKSARKLLRRGLASRGHNA